jgi:hypothetical protein
MDNRHFSYITKMKKKKTENSVVCATAEVLSVQLSLPTHLPTGGIDSRRIRDMWQDAMRTTANRSPVRACMWLRLRNSVLIGSDYLDRFAR